MSKLILHKFFSIITGLLFALILLETAMWTGGFVLSSRQKYKNEIILKNKSQYTAMCIGESTTAGEYPLNLQKILDTSYPNKFSVIDAGLDCTNLENILNNLDSNILKYRPDIAVCMMGINDGFVSEDYSKNSREYTAETKNNKIKIYKLYILLKEHIKSLLKTKEAFADDIILQNENLHILQQGVKLHYEGKYAQSEAIFKKLLEKDPYNPNAYSYLIILYSAFLNRYDTAYQMALKALDMNLYDKSLYYSVIINYNLEHNNIKTAKQFITQAINDTAFVFDSGLYNIVKKFITQEEKSKILHKMMMQKTDISYAITAINYIEEKDFEKAEKYFNMAEELRFNCPDEQTMKLYRLIVQKLIDSNIKVICMQYPVRSIKPLQHILKDTHYYDKVTFLSNEQIFKQALKEKTYNEIFRDQFAGDFGHCTDYGNTLIAQNLAKTLTDLTKND